MHALARTLALLALLIGAAPSARAQYSGGLKVGATAFTIAGETTTRFSPRVGLGASLWLHAELTGALGLQAELSYLTKGAMAEARVGDLFPEEPGADTPIELKLTYTYLEVPLLLTWDLPEVGRLSPRVYAGPHVSFLQDAYLRYRLRDDPYGEPEPDESVRSRDYGLTLGTQAAFPAGRFGDLVVSVQASFGLGNLRQATPAFHARGVFVSAGFSF